MNHSFDISIATEYSVDVAIFLNNIAFWTQKNIANHKHFYEGKYWTYNSYLAFTELFPYWSIQTVRRIINNCIEHDLIVKGNFNFKRYDQTNWYALTTKGLELYPTLLSKINTPLLESTGVASECTEKLYNFVTPLLESTDGSVDSNRPIPDTKQILTTTTTNEPPREPENPSESSSISFFLSLLDVYHDVFPDKPKIPLVTDNLKYLFRQLIKNWKVITKNKGEEFSIDVFRDLMMAIKLEAPGYAFKPFEHKGGVYRPSDIFVFIKLDNVIKLFNKEFK